MPLVTLGENGLLTIPKCIQDSLQLLPGDEIQFFDLGNGRIEFVAKNKSITNLKGFLKARTKFVSLNEMEDAMISGASGSV